VKPEQIAEWFENPVTQRFHELLKKRLDEAYAQRAEVYFPGEPYKTQESKANLLGVEGELADLVQMFEEKDLSQLEESAIDEERVRNPPRPRPGAH
jgi:hypothetical protein